MCYPNEASERRVKVYHRRVHEHLVGVAQIGTEHIGFHLKFLLKFNLEAAVAQ